MKAKTDSQSAAFTLVELLVVITIIVILLALLIPALDKAIYQAQLTVCGTQVRGIAQSATTYAMEFRRTYPHRTVLAAGNQPLMLATESLDDRALLGSYISLKLMQDPFEDTYLIARDETAAGTRVHASYQMWFGVRFAPYSSPDGTAITPRGMYKIGDKFNWYDDYPFSSHNGKVNSYSLLVSDFDFSGVDQRVMNSHPDSSSTLALKTSSPAPSAVPSTPATPVTGPPEYYSRYEGGGTRGLTDSNYAFADGSVVRHTGLTLNHDDRLSAVPYWTGWQGWSNYCIQIPLY